MVACVAEGCLEQEQLSPLLAAATQQASVLLPVVQACLVEGVKKRKLQEAQP